MTSTKVNPKVAQQLLQAINEDFNLAAQLKELLKEERSYLEQRQYTAHQQLIKSKTDYLMQLEKADCQRRQVMTEMGFSHDKSGFDQFVKQIPPAWQARFYSSWEKLSDTLNACARLNKVNGKILAHSQNSMDRLMSIIKGTNNNVSIYQSNGRRNIDGAHRMLATA